MLQSWHGRWGRQRGGYLHKPGWGGKKPQEIASWQDCKTAVVFRFPSSPSPHLWSSSFTCPSPSVPDPDHWAKQSRQWDGATRQDQEQSAQPWLPGGWLPQGALENTAAFECCLMGREVCYGCTKHGLPALRGTAGVMPLSRTDIRPVVRGMNSRFHS